MNVLAICSLALIWIHVSIYGEEMGPFDLSVISSGRCPPESNGKDLMKYESRIKRISRSDLILNMNLSFLIPFDDKLSLKLVLAKQTTQGWKDNYFQVVLPKACTVFKDYFQGSLEYIAKQMSKPTERDVCLPTGNYPLAVRLKHKFDPKVAFFYNRYRGRLTLVLGEDVVFCNEAIFDVLPHHTG